MSAKVEPQGFAAIWNLEKKIKSLTLRINTRELTYDPTTPTPMRNVAEKSTSHPFFSPLCHVTQLLESREVRLELKRGDCVRVQREIVKFIPFPFSSQLTIW